MSRANRRRRDSEDLRPSRSAAIAPSSFPSLFPEDEPPVLPLYRRGQSAFAVSPTRSTPRSRAILRQVSAPKIVPSTRRAPTSSRFSSTRHLIGYWTADRAVPSPGRRGTSSSSPGRRVPSSIPPPRGSTVCERRAERRAVIFATRSTGKGSRANRRFTNESRLTCQSRTRR